MRKGKRKNVLRLPLPAVTIRPLTEKAAVMLQGLQHIVLRLADGNILGDQASHLVPSQNDLFPLVGLFFTHNGGHHLWRELALRKELPHTDGLVKGGRTLVQVDFLFHIPLAALVQIGQLHRRAHFNFAFVHKVEQVRHKTCQTDIAFDLRGTVTCFR